MSRTKLRVGMIGAESLARHNLDAWSKSSDARVMAIYGRTQSKPNGIPTHLQPCTKAS